MVENLRAKKEEGSSSEAEKPSRFWHVRFGKMYISAIAKLLPNSLNVVQFASPYRPNLQPAGNLRACGR